MYKKILVCVLLFEKNCATAVRQDVKQDLLDARASHCINRCPSYLKVGHFTKFPYIVFVDLNADEREISEDYVPFGALPTAGEGNTKTETAVSSSESYNLATQAIERTLDSDSIIRINDKRRKKHKFVNPAEPNHKRGEVFTEAKAKAKQRNAVSSTTLYKNCLEDLDDNEFAKAVNALKDDKNAIAFMTIKGPRRLTWLRSLWHSELCVHYFNIGNFVCCRILEKLDDMLLYLSYLNLLVI